MSPSDYLLFAAIVRHGSLSATARAFGMSPAMVSKRLARLEDRLGSRLVHRTTRRLALTGPGERFHADVVAILGAIDDAERRLTAPDEAPHGPLRVSAPTSFGRLHIAPHLHRFLTSFPSVELEFNLSDERIDILAGGVDLVVRITPDLPRGLVAHRLADNRRVLCASPGYLRLHGQPATIDDVQGHRLIAAEGQLPWRLARGSRQRQIEGSSAVRTNSSEVIRELALQGYGIALRSLWDVDDALETGRLVPILPEWHEPDDLAIYAIHPKAPAPMPATDAFVRFLNDILSSASSGLGATDQG